MRKQILVKSINVVLLFLVGLIALSYLDLSLLTFNAGFIYDNCRFLRSTACGFISFLTIYLIFLSLTDKTILIKIFTFIFFALTIALIIFYYFKSSGLYQKIKSVEDIRNYVSSFKNYAVLMFILIQFLQVIVLPIPSIVTTGAGVLLFGPFKGALYSCIGILTGSILSFFIGRVLGVKFVSWIIGKENLEKWLYKIEGKDKILLVFMFLFPFFPDDMLCMVSGITRIKTSEFITIIFTTRVISIFVSSYSINNDLIPFNTWWGILLLVLFFIFSLSFAYCILKKGEKSLGLKYIEKQENI